MALTELERKSSLNPTRGGKNDRFAIRMNI